MYLPGRRIITPCGAISLAPEKSLYELAGLPVRRENRKNSSAETEKLYYEKTQSEIRIVTTQHKIQIIRQINSRLQ